MAPRQLALDLPAQPRFGREDFLVARSNEAAFALVEEWPRWRDRVALLIGPEGAGKSHLAAIWAERAGAGFLSIAALQEGAAPALLAQGPLVIEDADRSQGVEAPLFHLVNLARGREGWLLITARERPGAWGFSTPDLVSRLRLAPSAEIEEPDAATMRAVLVKLFGDRQIAVDASVVEYLALHGERSLGTARALVAALDGEALAQGRRVTRAMAAQVLRLATSDPDLS